MSTAFAIRLHQVDDIAIARADLTPGTTLDLNQVGVRQKIPAGHKIAIRAIAAGASVRRYGQIIGFATEAIAAGDHVHVHNLQMRDFARDYAFGADVKAIEYVDAPATFEGIVREDGRVATRNYLGVLTTVNCSATVAKGIAAHFTAERLKDFPQIDGVVALTQPLGCCIDTNGEGIGMLRRTLAGYAQHPNFAG